MGEIAEQLKLWRTKARLTQSEVAAKLGISRGRYANWENDQANPPMEYMVKLANLGAFPESPWAIAESRSPYGMASKELVRLTIETLYDRESEPRLRELAYQELLRMLDLEKGHVRK